MVSPQLCMQPMSVLSSWDPGAHPACDLQITGAIGHIFHSIFPLRGEITDESHMFHPIPTEVWAMMFSATVFVRAKSWSQPTHSAEG